MIVIIPYSLVLFRLSVTGAMNHNFSFTAWHTEASRYKFFAHLYASKNFHIHTCELFCRGALNKACNSKVFMDWFAVLFYDWAQLQKIVAIIALVMLPYSREGVIYKRYDI